MCNKHSNLKAKIGNRIFFCVWRVAQPRIFSIPFFILFLIFLLLFKKKLIVSENFHYLSLPAREEGKKF